MLGKVKRKRLRRPKVSMVHTVGNCGQKEDGSKESSSMERGRRHTANMKLTAPDPSDTMCTDRVECPASAKIVEEYKAVSLEKKRRQEGGKRTRTHDIK